MVADQRVLAAILVVAGLVHVIEGQAQTSTPSAILVTPLVTAPNTKPGAATDPYSKWAVPPASLNSPEVKPEGSNLNQTQAINQMAGHGYSQLHNVHADSNSQWLWQADAEKGGQTVKVGIDYAGNVVQLSGAARAPCPQRRSVGFDRPGVGFSDAASCTGR